MKITDLIRSSKISILPMWKEKPMITYLKK